MASTAQSETAALRKVLLRHPRAAFGDSERIAAQWRELNYRSAPDPARAVDEFERFAALLADAGAEVLLAGEVIGEDGEAGSADDGARLTLDSIYVRDAALITDAGAILCAMGKAARAAEPDALRADLAAAGIDVVGAIGGAGRLEGGDVCWLAGNRLAVGRGYRTNDEGIRQLAELTRGIVEELVVVPLPHWRGPADVFHLMSILSPVADDAVLVHAPLLPVPFREWLLERGQHLIEVDPDEFDTMGCNVLALSPGRCVMLASNPRTRARLEAAGIEVLEYTGEEISRKGEGGPTCLTRPLVREQ
ncbi:MAG: arginine deiminase family protein [Acidobacteriota bacterium]|jgi:N-dimethylarginine dimethylaminohydrolase